MSPWRLDSPCKLALAALLPLVLAVCHAPAVHGQAFLPATLMDAIDAAFVLNAFKELAVASGYGDMLSSPDFNGTVFAPNDLAFAALGYIPVNTTANVTSEEGPPEPAVPAAAPSYPPALPANATGINASAPALPAVPPAMTPVPPPGVPPAPPAPALVPPSNASRPFNASWKPIIGFHIVHRVKAFPVSSLKQGEKLVTQEGHPLIIDTSTPGLVHVYGNVPTKDPTNFGTILQFQEIKGGKAVLYLIDKVLLPPKK